MKSFKIEEIAADERTDVAVYERRSSMMDDCLSELICVFRLVVKKVTTLEVDLIVDKQSHILVRCFSNLAAQKRQLIIRSDCLIIQVAHDMVDVKTTRLFMTSGSLYLDCLRGTRREYTRFNGDRTNTHQYLNFSSKEVLLPFVVSLPTLDTVHVK